MSKSKGSLRRKRERRRFHAREAASGRAFVEAIGGPGSVVIKPRKPLLYTENPARVVRDLLVDAGFPVDHESFDRAAAKADEPTPIPAWTPCPNCEGYQCSIHKGMHADACPCPPVDEWPTSPYSSGGLP